MRALLACIALTSVAFGQRPSLTEGVCPPVRPVVRSYPPILQDLHCRVKDPEYWRLKDKNDLVSWVHELNHGASNQSCPPGKLHGIYLLEGKAWVARNPEVTITQVAAAVPLKDQGPIWHTYMVASRRDWDSQPLYLLDEWTAYLHGAIAADQLGYTEDVNATRAYAREMERYCRAMVSVVEKRDPEYSDMDTLVAFVEWSSSRLEEKSDAPLLTQGGESEGDE